MYFSSANSATIQETVQAIIVEKPLDKIISQPTIKNMNIMTEQMSKIVDAVKTAKWGLKHSSLALVLGKYDYITGMRDATATIDWISKPAPVNKSIMAFSMHFETLTLQESKKVKKVAYKMQEVVMDIGVEWVVYLIEYQYLEKLNDE